jgi:hypothetical protein
MVKTCMTTFKVSRFLGFSVHRFLGFITHQFTWQHVIIMATGVESHHHAKISTSTHFPILWMSSVSVDVLVAGQYHTCCCWRWWSDTLWVRDVRLQLHSFLTFYLGFDGSDTTGTFIVFCFPAILFRFYLRFAPFKWHVVGSAISIPVLYTHDSISILETASMEKFSILVKICVDHQPNQGPLEMLISCRKYWKSFETHFVCRF